MSKKRQDPDKLKRKRKEAEKAANRQSGPGPQAPSKKMHSQMPSTGSPHVSESWNEFEEDMSLLRVGNWLVVGEGDPQAMNVERYGRIRLYRPRLITEIKIRDSAEAHFRAKYQPGVYKDAAKINEIIQYQFAYYGGVLNSILSSVASGHLMSFVLYQYDKSRQIENAANSGKLSEAELDRWLRTGPIYRRTSKYLAERITLLAPSEAPNIPENEQLDALDHVWSCAEQIIELYNLSEQTFSLFPEETQLEIRPPGEMEYVKLSLKNHDSLSIQARTRTDTANRNRYIPESRYISDFAEHDKLIGPALRKHIGIGYEESLRVLVGLVEGTQPPLSGFPISFVQRDEAIRALAEHLEFPPSSVDTALSGFSLSVQNMTRENRVVWKPKQEYRAYKRAFFEFPHPSGPHLSWSSEMFKESLHMLITEVVFQKFPTEWRTNEVNKAIAKISNLAGKWFETATGDNLKTAGFLGATSFNRTIGEGPTKLAIPAEVGELDCIAYCPSMNLLLLGECKLVRFGSEPAFFREDISKFITGNDSFQKKFLRKIEWVRSNHTAICRALESLKAFGNEVKPLRMASILITYYPNFASSLIKDFPCVSLTELMMAMEANTDWPYSEGVFDL